MATHSKIARFAICRIGCVLRADNGVVVGGVGVVDLVAGTRVLKDMEKMEITLQCGIVTKTHIAAVNTVCERSPAG